MMDLRVRDVTDEDCRLLWEWANDPVTRAASFIRDAILWETHADWFARKTADPACRMWLVCDESGAPVAHVRFDVSGEEAEISVNTAPGKRGMGYGTAAIRIGSERMLAEPGVARLIAHIKPNNTVSIRAFAKAGYVEAGFAKVKSQRALKMVLGREQE